MYDVSDINKILLWKLDSWNKKKFIEKRVKWLKHLYNLASVYKMFACKKEVKSTLRAEITLIES